MERPDDVLELLVRDDPSDEQEGRLAVVVDIADDGVAGNVELRQVGQDGQDARRGVPRPLELLPVEFGVAEGQVHLAREEAHLEAPLVAFPGQDAVEVEEEPVGRDVVIDHDLPVGDPGEELRDGRADREMEDDDVLGPAEPRIFPVVAGEAGHLGVEEPDEDLGPVSRGAEDLADLDHLVGDGVPVGQRGRELMDVHATRFPSSRPRSARYLLSMRSQE